MADGQWQVAERHWRGRREWQSLFLAIIYQLWYEKTLKNHLELLKIRSLEFCFFPHGRVGAHFSGYIASSGFARFCRKGASVCGLATVRFGDSHGCGGGYAITDDRLEGNLPALVQFSAFPLKYG